MRFKTELVEKDFTIIGGGMPGICAAIQAARLGLSVALINNRGYLGGNASPEVRITISGGDGSSEFNFYARESGIMEELRLENLYRNPQGNPYLWHTVLLDYVLREKNISLYLNTNVDEVITKEDGTIESVSGSQIGTEKRLEFKSPYFLDDTGDGTIGYLAAAEYRMGREASSEFGERIAPEKADDHVLLSTLSFYSKDTGRKAPFVLPDFAKSLSVEETLKNRIIPDRIPGNSRYEGYRMQWFYEIGYGRNQISDAEEIMQEQRELVYGIWDHIKKGEQYDSDNFDFEYVSPVTGKRESRRLMGDYILTEGDIVAQNDFEDTIGHGGWSFDLHALKGFFSTDLINRHYVLNGVYPIPYRSCYSKDVDNLFVASRCMSTTHVAFGSTRVMGTLAVLGQSVAIAAYLCKKYSVNPRGIYENYLDEFKQELIKNDQYIIGTVNEDEKDLARKATITASSNEKLNFDNMEYEKVLNEEVALILPVEKYIGKISLFLKAKVDTEIEYIMYTAIKDQNYKPQQKLMKKSINLKASEEYQWIDLDLGCEISTGKIFIQIHKNDLVSMGMNNDRVNGVFYLTKHYFSKKSTYIDIDTLELMKEMWEVRKELPCFKGLEENIYSASNINNGYSRNHKLPNLWLSEKSNDEEWVSLKFNEEKEVSQVVLVFDSNLNYIYHNLEIYLDFNVFPEIIKDYTIFAKLNGEYVEIKSIKENYQRKNIIDFSTIKTDEIKVVFNKTNGSPRVTVYEIRAYA
ncbi:FAD dependent oxidoreductase [Clostridium grantii DSM 8605]|uniref:FAD dependent oxidoreductase n=2 Tax=Clostridium TaxID=1485 RepID=A0A1M5TQT4_9CLOT|nr:FAD dependent oxidoreductase [Clostridium grantii DSM 8605]